MTRQPGGRRIEAARRVGVAAAATAVVAVLAAGCSASPSDGAPPFTSSSAASAWPSVSAAPSPSGSSSLGPAPVGTPTPEVSAVGVSRPQRPPAPVCDGPGLAGPANPPAGAVRVGVGSSLSELVAGGRPGTTYWLAPGVHRLGSGEYDQVVPQDGDRFVGAPGAVLDGRRLNRYAFGGHATGVRISHLTVRNFGAPGENHNEGVVNHDSATDWTLEASTLERNAGAAVMLGSGSTVTRNCLRDNGQYGFNAYHADGVRGVVLRGNEITGNNTDDWEKRIEGCGCTGGGKFWETVGAEIVGNHVHDNRGSGLWADTNNAGFLFQGNYIEGNDSEAIFYETSYNARIVDNTFVGNGHIQGMRNPGFPTGTVYLSEAGSDPRVPGPYGDALLVSRNLFLDNWSGVVVWENADRFAGSPANTSSGTTTLVNPAATVTACATAKQVARRPLLDDCRWKSRNVLVEANEFVLDASAVPGCRASRGCGFNGVFSNYGTYPDWSPYQGERVAQWIAFEQNNSWRNNSYRGPWAFVAPTQGNVLDAAAWRAAPYRQDVGSTFT